ncbi:MAG: GNAT family N-acetyltransferase [Alphaproteobacteria bacterium]|nr:GNAT family N-acetyltransferase [Alphaproteobacteria bacterium]
MRRGVARIYVALSADGPGIAGFYSLSAASIERSTLPPDIGRRLPHYPVPVALIGRLAVDRRFQKRGLGTALMADALDRVRRASGLIAVYAAVVDPKDGAAAAFYRHLGFLPLAATTPRMFLALASLPR